MNLTLWTQLYKPGGLSGISFIERANIPNHQFPGSYPTAVSTDGVEWEFHQMLKGAPFAIPMGSFGALLASPNCSVDSGYVPIWWEELSTAPPFPACLGMSWIRGSAFIHSIHLDLETCYIWTKGEKLGSLGSFASTFWQRLRALGVH